MPTKSSKFFRDFLFIPLFIFIYNLAINLANDLYLPCLPTMQKYLHASSQVVQLTFSLGFIGVALPQLLLGPLSDAKGRRPILYIGALFFLIPTFFAIKAKSALYLTILRIIQGAGICSVNVATFSIINDLYKDKDRVRMLALLSLFISFSPLIGPGLGSYLLNHFGWESNFLTIFFIGLVSVLGLIFSLHETNTNKNPKAIELKTLLKNYKLLMTDEDLIRHLIPYGLALGALISYMSSAPLYLLKELKLTSTQYGVWQFLIFGSFIIGSIFMAIGTKYFKPKKLLFTGLIIICLASTILLIMSFTEGKNIYKIALPMMLFEIGYSFAVSPLMNGVMKAGEKVKGFASSLLGFFMAIFSALAGMVISYFYNDTALSIAIIIFIMSSCAFLSYFFIPHEK